MATIDFPSAIANKHLMTTFKETGMNNTLSTDMDTGPAKKRRRGTGYSKFIELTFRLSSSELDTFIAFYENTTASATLAFNYTHPRTGTVYEARLASSPYTYSTLTPNLFDVPVKIELLPVGAIV